MKKVGIITIVNANNYGAELQAFALQKKIEQLGYDSEIINYMYYKNWRFHDSQLSQPFIPMNGKQKLIYWLKYRLLNFLIDKIFPTFNPAIKNRNEKFAKFHTINTRFSKEFISIDSLYTTPPQYDIYIVGSDQVWNPYALSSIEPYFLTFVSSKLKKIAYASSFGITSIPETLQSRIKDLLNNIDIISVRETSGVELVKNLTGRQAELVADPTFLLSKKEWKEYMIPYPTIAEKYILIYQLSDSKTIVDFSIKIGKERNLPVYRICKRAFKNQNDSGVNNILDAGPSEFLSLIAHADCLVTNSFHGTAFAINFNTPFYTIISPQKSNNSRMESLLQTTDLINQLLCDDIDIESIPTDNLRPNFEKANFKVNEIRQKSIEYLRNNLN